MKLFVFLAIFIFCMLCNEARSNEISSGQSSVSDDELGNYPQLSRNAYVIAELEDRLVRLKSKLGQLSSAPSLRKIYSDLTYRVGRLEGTGCNDDQMQCGGNSRQCISEILACDGIKDCKNGKDEDPAVCDTSALKPSSAYKATVMLDACIGGGKNNLITFRTEFQTLHRSKFFPSRLTFTESVQGYIRGQLVMTVVTNGEFQSGTRRFRSYTPGPAGLWSECFIPEYNVERLYCRTFKGMDGFPCVRHFVMDAVKPYS